VAEVFMDSDCQNVRKYKEFERSAQSEWVDLGIDLHAFIAGQPTGEADVPGSGVF
jgi:hypothetical protein